MKKQIIINSIITSGLLLASTVSFSANNDTDLIYGNGSVITSESEAYVAGLSTQNNQANDIIYGDQKEPAPSRGESYERFVDNRNSNTDLIYGS